MAITGAHVVLHSAQAEELRAVLADVLDLPHVDAGGGWLIFALPPAEVAVHPADEPHHELTFQCDDLDATTTQLQTRGVVFKGEPETQAWGTSRVMMLPGGVEVMLYQPRHAVPR